MQRESEAELSASAERLAYVVMVGWVASEARRSPVNTNDYILLMHILYWLLHHYAIGHLCASHT